MFSFFKDENYEWVVCVGITVHTIIRNGVFFSYGVFAADFKNKYNSSMTLLTLIMCIPGTLLHLCSPFTALLRSKIKKNGNRKITLSATFLYVSSLFLTCLVPHPIWMLLTFSLPHGVAYTLAFFSNSMVLMEYFPRDHKHHVFASFFLFFSFPISSLIFNPLASYLIFISSWQTTFFIFGSIILLIGSPLAWLFKDKENKTESNSILETKINKENEKVEKKEKEKKGMTYNDLKEVISNGYKDPKKISWWFGNMISMLIYLVPFFLLVHYLEKKGTSKQLNSLCMVLLSLGELLSCILLAMFGEKLKGKLINPCIISLFFCSLVSLLWGLVPHSTKLYFFLSFIFGFLVGTPLVFSYSCSAEITNLPIVVAWSSTSFFKGIGEFIMPIFSSMIYDVTHDYSNMFYCISILAMISTILHCIAAYYSKKDSK